ncbi:MAG: glycoside hydrolase family 38 C-terminal domain-containing protein [bacterium]|nr:glycoside hydrolase family 38 C-terminal domain-containing protein [bacterium]
MKIGSYQAYMQRSLERLQTEVGIAEAMLVLYPRVRAESEVMAVKRLMEERTSGLNPDNVTGFVRECELLMQETANFLKSFTVHMVAHAHIDMNWMWGYDETVAVTLDTFKTMLKLMERYPDFTFSQSQASVYRIVEKYNPAMLEEIRQQVAEGRWEVSSCTWVEGDKNLASGESQVRQVLYAKRFFRDIFGLGYDDIKLDFEPDTFGHNLNIPAILSRAGVRYYYHCRALDGPKLSHWQAPDGSSLLCYLEKGGDWYNYDVTPCRMAQSTLAEIEETGSHDVLRVYGVGDHGGGPTVRDIESIIDMAAWPVFPTVKFSTYGEYFSKIENTDLKLPVLQGERNFIFTGCYTSQSETKAANRHGEKALSTAEAFSALAGTLAKDFVCTQVNLREAWEKLLFNQFHDILPGSGKRQTRHYAMGQHQEVKATAGTATKLALAALNGVIDTEVVVRAADIRKETTDDDRAFGAGAGFWHDLKGLSLSSVDDSAARIFTVFNPSAFSRTEVVEAVLWDMADREGQLVVKDCYGREVPSQFMEEPRRYWGHTFRRIFFEALDIPALGYKTFIAYIDTTRQKTAPRQWSARLEASSRAVLENDRLRVELDTVNGAVKSLVMKDTSIELVSEQKPLALFRIIDEGPSLFGENGTVNEGMTAWLVGAYSNIEPVTGVRFVDEVQPEFHEGIEKSSFKAVNGPLRSGFIWSVRLRSSELTTAIYLDKCSDVIHIDCKCDWLETGRKGDHVPQLNIIFPLLLQNSVRHFEVPFGAIRRDVEDMDIPVLRWADITGSVTGISKQAGLTVMTDSKYGYRTGDDFIAVSLIRSSCDPDLYPELGEHRFSLAMHPHYGACDRAAAYRHAISFDQPLIVSQAVLSKGTMPAECSFIEVTNDNLVLSALKQPEDGSGIIIRLYEVTGMDTEAEIHLCPELLGEKVLVTETDLLERKTGVPEVFPNDAVKCAIPAHGLVTLWLETA